MSDTASLHKVFVYGTLKRGEPNHESFSKSGSYYKFLYNAKTSDKFPLIIATKYNIPFLLYRPGEGCQVKGEVYEVDDSVLKKLDILEDHPNYYVRGLYDVQNLDAEREFTEKAWIYVIKNFKEDLLSQTYFENYSNSGDHGLKYVESVVDKMGILNLSKLLADVAPQAIKETDIKTYFGRKVAIDASMCLYQFLIAVRTEGNQLTNVDGETTSHLVGTFYRTIRLLEHGIKPVYVFDGKPPELKSGELNKRMEKRVEAQKALDKATEAGDSAEMDKFNRRLVKVTKQHSEEAKQLLSLMGVPYIEAPCEAEAQCAALVKAGKVFATATEDMDALTFGSNVVLRRLTFSEARKMPIQEIHLHKVLEGLELTHEEFIDLCILMGCDYTDSIRGIGPKKSIELIRQHKCIEQILNHIDNEKYHPPENWNYEGARQLFVEPEIADPDRIELKWNDPDEEGMVKFLCGDRQFSEERVRNGVKKLMKARGTSTQARLDGFFTVLASTPAKRKIEEKKKNTPNKRGKGTGVSKTRGKGK
ncbi:flap endonuclease 1 isoform X2 [Cylas formicarius]|uniref:flap endonuclease 1 isoform X2 n=1 Tax=Cylas formicarius TaxID=197179 RepID=UPI002958B773|nr:flap endonuclease 1 isoform X2 [Cylas formicarius]